MRVETAVMVPKAAVRDPKCHSRLVREARARLTELGIAAQHALAEEPVIEITREPTPSKVVIVTIRWETRGSRLA
jgi:hypothetical protein